MGQLTILGDCKVKLSILAINTNYKAQIARDIFDTFERLIELSETISFCLERFSIYIDIFTLKGLLGDRLVLFYKEIIIFCLEAAQAYNRGKASKFPRFNG